MHRKYYLLIALANLFLTISLATPILVISETKVGWSGNTSEIRYKMNIFEYISNDANNIVSFFMITFLIFSIIGAIYALIQVIRKKPSVYASKVSFILGFAPAILGALQIDSKSYLFFIFCVISFFVISLCSIRMMKFDDWKNNRHKYGDCFYFDLQFLKKVLHFSIKILKFFLSIITPAINVRIAMVKYKGTAYQRIGT